MLSIPKGVTVRIKNMCRFWTEPGQPVSDANRSPSGAPNLLHRKLLHFVFAREILSASSPPGCLTEFGAQSCHKVVPRHVCLHLAFARATWGQQILENPLYKPLIPLVKVHCLFFTVSSAFFSDSFFLPPPLLLKEGIYLPLQITGPHPRSPLHINIDIVNKDFLGTEFEKSSFLSFKGWGSNINPPANKQLRGQPSHSPPPSRRRKGTKKKL